MKTADFTKRQLMEIIYKKCLECCCDDINEVHNCKCSLCPIQQSGFNTIVIKRRGSYNISEETKQTMANKMRSIGRKN